jgi:hypothetical protein
LETLMPFIFDDRFLTPPNERGRKEMEPCFSPTRSRTSCTDSFTRTSASATDSRRSTPLGLLPLGYAASVLRKEVM